VAVLPGFLLLGIGLGAALVAAQTSAMRDVDPRQAGLVSAVVNTGHEFGAALGVALASVLASASLGETATGVGGFRTAFAVAAAIALVTGIAATRALPPGRPEAGAAPVSLH
jgi:predicted MFS family arabinose efflux permease